MNSIFAMSMLFDTLVRNGGPQLVLEKWDSEWADCRKNAMMAMQHLLENDLVSFYHFTFISSSLGLAVKHVN